MSPDGAGLDDFAWRVSLAELREPGAFSAYPGVSRTLLLLEGRAGAARHPTVTGRNLFAAAPPCNSTGARACSPPRPVSRSMPG